MCANFTGVNLSEERKKVLITFLKQFNLTKEYALSKYKSVYTFIRYNYKSKFYNWVADTEFKYLFFKEKPNE